MATNPEARVVEFLDQTTEAVSAAMKAGAKFQEDMTNFWASALGQADSLQQWQARSRSVLSQAMPTMQKNADEYLRVWGQTYRSGIELMKKAFESARCDSLGDCQNKAQDLWESSMATLRTNTQAVTQANVRAMESWADVVRTTIGNGVSAAAASARGVEEVIGKASSRAERVVAAAR